MLRDEGIPVPFRDLPRVGCPHCSSFMHLVGESLSYLSMSHTGPATRLKLPLFLYNSTAALPPLFLSVRIQAVYLIFYGDPERKGGFVAVKHVGYAPVSVCCCSLSVL